MVVALITYEELISHIATPEEHIIHEYLMRADICMKVHKETFKLGISRVKPWSNICEVVTHYFRLKLCIAK